MKRLMALAGCVVVVAVACGEPVAAPRTVAGRAPNAATAAAAGEALLYRPCAFDRSGGAPPPPRGRPPAV